MSFVLKAGEKTTTGLWITRLEQSQNINTRKLNAIPASIRMRPSGLGTQPSWTSPEMNSTSAAAHVEWSQGDASTGIHILLANILIVSTGEIHDDCFRLNRADGLRQSQY